MSVFWSTWPLNRCWVEGLGWAAETCSCSVDLSIQTEPSIIRVWRLCPWTPAYTLSASKKPPCSTCACKNQPRFWKKSVAFLPLVCLLRRTFSHTRTHTHTHTHTHTPPFSISFHREKKKKGWEFVLNPSFLLFQNRRGIWKKRSLQLYLIICGRPNQGQPCWSHLHGFQVFALQVSVVPVQAPGVRTTWTLSLSLLSLSFFFLLLLLPLLFPSSDCSPFVLKKLNLVSVTFICFPPFSFEAY